MGSSPITPTTPHNTISRHFYLWLQTKRSQTIGQTELKTTALPDEVIIRFPGWDNKPQLWMTIDNKIWGQLHDQEAPVRLEIEVSYSAII